MNWHNAYDVYCLIRWMVGIALTLYCFYKFVESLKPTHYIITIDGVAYKAETLADGKVYCKRFGCTARKLYTKGDHIYIKHFNQYIEAIAC